MPPLDKDQLLEFLHQHKEEYHQRFGVTSLGLAGSYARGEATDVSDIDIVVKLQSDNTFRSFFGLLHSLQDAFDVPVDLVTESSLKPLIKEHVMKDIHYV